MKKEPSYIIALVDQQALIQKANYLVMLLFKIPKIWTITYEIIGPIIKQTYSLEYRLLWVANATVGSPYANALHDLVAPFTDQLPIWLSGHGATPGEGPRAEGARRVLNGSKLRFAS